MPAAEQAVQIALIRVVAVAGLADIQQQVAQAVLMPVTILITALLLLEAVAVVEQEGRLVVAGAAVLVYLGWEPTAQLACRQYLVVVVVAPMAPLVDLVLDHLQILVDLVVGLAAQAADLL
jgi:hypothetical protein